MIDGYRGQATVIRTATVIRQLCELNQSLLEFPTYFNRTVRPAMSNYIARTNMIKQQLRTGNVLDERVLALFEQMPRDEFVPPEMTSFAYSDMQIPLANNQRMMTPLEEALLLESLALQGHEVVLEIGTGSGFLTAMLSRLCKKVVSVDYYAEFTKNAQHKLQSHDCLNIDLYTGDAIQGWLDFAPYDVIVFTGAIEKLTDIQRLQLLPGGRLFTIIGKGPVMQAQLHRLDHQQQWTQKIIFETALPSLVEHRKPNSFDF